MSFFGVFIVDEFKRRYIEDKRIDGCADAQ